MFGFFKKKQQTMTASVDGKVLPMSEASDEVFSSCALGDGVVICPTGDGMVSVMMKDSNHAIGLTLEDGTDILIHIGVNTVELKGEGFEALVAVKDQVKAGTELIRFDRKMMEEKGYCMEIMQLVLEGENSDKVKYYTGMYAKAGETVVAQW